MTEQVPDSCIFDGRKWSIEHWNGPTDCIPSNESLHIRTESPHTANWRGRIDHFLIHRCTLHLFKMEVTLPLSERPKIPPGARREVVKRHVPFELHSAEGRTDELRIERYDFFIFDNLTIPFSGELLLSYPHFDVWEIPWPADEEDESVLERVTLAFENGHLVAVE